MYFLKNIVSWLVFLWIKANIEYCLNFHVEKLVVDRHNRKIFAQIYFSRWNQGY